MEITNGSSLKSKRRVLKSIKDRIRRFNISIAEIGDHDLWKRAKIGMACIGNEEGYVNGVLSQAVELISSNGNVVVLDYEISVIK
jgi:uncharacterized protein YlxP (DUF503 family)